MRRYGLPEELVLAARTDAGWPEEKTARMWGKKALKVTRKALREAKKAIAAYPRNASDAEMKARMEARAAARRAPPDLPAREAVHA
jgi:hypothetical protein